jgi:hypothetical protein
MSATLINGVTVNDPTTRKTLPIEVVDNGTVGRLIVVSGAFVEPGASAVKYAVINESTAASNELVAAVTGKRIIVLSYTLLAGGTVNVTFQSAATAISGAMPLVANAGIAISDNNGLMDTVAGEALNLLSSDAIQVSGHLSYIEAD